LYRIPLVAHFLSLIALYFSSPKQEFHHYETFDPKEVAR